MPEFPAFLSGKVEVDVLVIGAGITGITAAWLLKKSGCRVAVVDQYGVGGGETGHTTVHLTCVTDARLSELASPIGSSAEPRPFGRQAWKVVCGRSMRNAAELGIRLRAAAGARPSGRRDGQGRRLRAGSAAQRCQTGPAVRFRRGAKRPRIRFSDARQFGFPTGLKFHPLEYLAALAKKIPGGGSHIFGNTPATWTRNARPPALCARNERLSQPNAAIVRIASLGAQNILRFSRFGRCRMKSIVGEPEVLEDTTAWHDLKAAVGELQGLQAHDGSVEGDHARAG